MTTRNLHHLNTLRRVLKSTFDEPVPESEFHQAELRQINNWDALFSRRLILSSFIVYIVFLLSQLVFCYGGLIYFDLDNIPAIFTVAQALNGIVSYFFPVLILGAGSHELFDNIKEELIQYRAFCCSVVALAVGFVLELSALIVIFTSSEHFVQTLYDFERLAQVTYDVTGFLRFYLIAAVNLSLLSLVVSAENWWIAKTKIETYLNRAEHLQLPIPDDWKDFKRPEWV